MNKYQRKNQRIAIAIGVLAFSGFILFLSYVLILNNKSEAPKTEELLVNMKYIGTMKDGPDMFVVYEYEDKSTRWFRVTAVLGDVHYLSEDPVLIENSTALFILVQWKPNRYAKCEGFLKIADGDPEGFCRRYHLPLNKIRGTCRGW